MNLSDLFLIKAKKVPLTEHQLRRQNFLTASEAGILLGVHPFAFRPASELDDDEAIMLGKLLERPILRWGARTTGHRIICNQFRVCKADGLFAAQHDALALDDIGIGYEAKTSGIRGGFSNRDLWGAPETDEVPEFVIAQAQQQMLVSDLETVWIPALIGGRGNLLFRVNRNEELIKIIQERGHDFWENHVQKDIPPAGDPPSLDLARLLHRTPKKIIVLNGFKEAATWRELDKAAKEAEKKADAAKAAMLVAAGDAEIVQDGTGQLTISKTESERIDTKLLREKYPSIATLVTKTTTGVRVTYKEIKAK